MTDVNISLSDIQNVKTIKVNGLGIFNIRKLGSNEELELSKKTRRRAKIYDELNSIDLTKYVTKDDKKLSDKKQKELDEILENIDRLSNEMHELLDYEQDLRKKRITDVNKGEKVKKLFDLIDDEGIEKLFRYAFGGLKVDDPETVEKKEEVKSDE